MTRRATIGAVACSIFTLLVSGADADQRVAADAFSAVNGPSILPPRSIGGYSRGCLTGGRELPERGASWQTMRPSRNRAWGHPDAIAFVEDLAAKAPQLGLSGILVGDISQPRGGPMPYGHSSHQLGLDVDIWLTEMPLEPLTREEREMLPFTSVLGVDGLADPALLTPAFQGLIAAAARDGRVARIFVHPGIKALLCKTAGPERAWLRRVRPWYGHDKHFHVRLNCPASSPDCRAQNPPPAGDGCGDALAYWFTPAPYRPKATSSKPRGPLRVADLPAVCGKIVRRLALPRPRPPAPPNAQTE